MYRERGPASLMTLGFRWLNVEEADDSVMALLEEIWAHQWIC